MLLQPNIIFFLYISFLIIIIKERKKHQQNCTNYTYPQKILSHAPTTFFSPILKIFPKFLVGIFFNFCESYISVTIHVTKFVFFIIPRNTNIYSLQYILFRRTHLFY